VETLIRLIHTHYSGLSERPREVLVQSSWCDGPGLPDRRPAVVGESGGDDREAAGEDGAEARDAVPC
jgi:hypothetical protein